MKGWPETLALEPEDGDTVVYFRCTDPDCDATWAGTDHAHLVESDDAD